MCGSYLRRFGLVLLAGLLILSFTIPALAGHGSDKPVKKGILLVTFGTSIPEAARVFANVEAAAKRKFPKTEIRWAFTAKMIRHKLAKQGKTTFSPEMALSKMAEEDFTHVAVQSLHIIGGEEFHNLYKTAKRFQGMPKGITKVVVGRPLISSKDDMLLVAEAMMKQVPKARKKGEAVLFMGHGTHHPGNAVYPAMNYVFSRMDGNVLVGTVEGYPGIGEVKEDLLKRKIKKAYLIPFMSVAGDHAVNDMASDEDDSWKSILTKAGIKCETILVGMAANSGIVDIWLNHLDRALSHFKETELK